MTTMMLSKNVFKLPPGSRLRCQTVERGQIEFALDADGRAVEPAPEGVTVLSAEVVFFDGSAIKLDDLPFECDASTIKVSVKDGGS